MSHHNQRALVLGECGREARARGLIEVIGRLVEEQEVRPGEDQLAERQPRPFAPAEGADPLAETLAAEEEMGEGAAQLPRRAEAQRLDLLPDGVIVRQVLQLLAIPAHFQFATAAEGAGVRF